MLATLPGRRPAARFPWSPFPSRVRQGRQARAHAGQAQAPGRRPAVAPPAPPSTPQSSPALAPPPPPPTPAPVPTSAPAPTAASRRRAPSSAAASSSPTPQVGVAAAQSARRDTQVAQSAATRAATTRWSPHVRRPSLAPTAGSASARFATDQNPPGAHGALMTLGIGACGRIRLRRSRERAHATAHPRSAGALRVVGPGGPRPRAARLLATNRGRRAGTRRDAPGWRVRVVTPYPPRVGRLLGPVDPQLGPPTPKTPVLLRQADTKQQAPRRRRAPSRRSARRKRAGEALRQRVELRLRAHLAEDPLQPRLGLGVDVRPSPPPTAGWTAAICACISWATAR